MDGQLSEFIENQKEFNQLILKTLNDKRIGYSENKYESTSQPLLEESPLILNDNVGEGEKKANVIEKLQAYMNEFVGVFFIALSVILAVSQLNPILGTLSSGFLIISLVYTGGHISRAHYNPAMTLLFFLRHEISLVDAIIYTVIQYTAALVGVSVGAVLIPRGSTVFAYGPSPNSTIMQVFVVEILYTFLLGWIVINVATAKLNHGNEFYGLAVGMGVTAIISTVGHISGACLNPSLGFATLIFHAVYEKTADKIVHLWIYILGPLMGAFLAVVVFFVTHTNEAKTVMKIVRKEGIKRVLI